MTREALLVRPDGPVPYGLANEAMHRLAERRLAGEIPDVVILLEHPPVFTAGRRARPDELLWSPDELAARGAEVHRIDRGGAFTFHGPGQLVGYPILDLGPKPDAAAHLRRMEEAVIRTGGPRRRPPSGVRTSRPACGTATTRSARSACGCCAPASRSTASR